MAAGHLLPGQSGAHGFSRGASFPLIRNLFQIFMLIVGFGYMELAWDRSREPIRSMGLPGRPGAVREFGLGAALGWGMVTVVLLIIALVGHFYVQLWTAPRAWGLLIVQLLTVVGRRAGGRDCVPRISISKAGGDCGPVRGDGAGSHYFRSAASDDAWLDSDSGVDQRGGSNFVIGGLLENSRTLAGMGIALCMDREHWGPVRPTAGEQSAGFERDPHLCRWTDLADGCRIWAGRQP